MRNGNRCRNCKVVPPRVTITNKQISEWFDSIVAGSLPGSIVRFFVGGSFRLPKAAKACPVRPVKVANASLTLQKCALDSNGRRFRYMKEMKTPLRRHQFCNPDWSGCQVPLSIIDSSNENKQQQHRKPLLPAVYRTSLRHNLTAFLRACNAQWDFPATTI